MQVDFELLYLTFVSPCAERHSCAQRSDVILPDDVATPGALDAQRCVAFGDTYKKTPLQNYIGI